MHSRDGVIAPSTANDQAIIDLQLRIRSGKQTLEHRISGPGICPVYPQPRKLGVPRFESLQVIRLFARDFSLLAGECSAVQVP